MDTRLNIYGVLGLEEGEAHVIRNAGGVVTDDEFKRGIQEEVGITPEWAAESFTDLDEDVRQSIARITSSKFIPHTDQVRGFAFDVATVRLREV
jgi:carbonic anhydrase